MSAHFAKAGISYFSVPKCACTSVKHLFYQIENNRRFKVYRINEQAVSVQDVYQTERFEAGARRRAPGAWAFAVVRSPAGRVVSCFRNRVVGRNALLRGKVRQALVQNGVSTEPDLSEFVDRLEDYRRLSPVVAWHLQPLSFFLGTQADYFDRLYNLGQLEEMRADLAVRLGRDVPELQHLQTVGPKLSVSDLTPAQVDKIDEWYSEDHRIFGRAF
jgi:hypothetical protein